MSLPFFPVPLLGAVKAANTYADFLAHITSRATAGSVAYNGQWAAGPSGTGLYIVERNPFSDADYGSPGGTGTMYGTPWNDAFFGPQPNTASRVVLHCYPSAAAYETARAAGQRTLLKVESASDGPLNALYRNGFPSSADPGPWDGTYRKKVTEFIRWDEALKKAFTRNPSIAGSESEYVF